MSDWFRRGVFVLRSLTRSRTLGVVQASGLSTSAAALAVATAVSATTPTSACSKRRGRDHDACERHGGVTSHTGGIREQRADTRADPRPRRHGAIWFWGEKSGAQGLLGAKGQQRVPAKVPMEKLLPR
jgi:hypothetical protein